MKPSEVRTGRMNRGWSQSEAARRLGVTQPYVAMLEKGRRPLTDKLARKVVALYKLSPAALPVSDRVPEQSDPQRLAQDFASLGYPGYAYLRPHVAKRNPGEVLLLALAQNDLESRLVEALPWLLLRYWNMDFSWLVSEVKKFDLQNRLGFLAAMARRMSERTHDEDRTRALSNVETTLDRSRLAREDYFVRLARNQAERLWLMQNRSEEARHWNLLTDLRPEHLNYDARTA
jgi:transcriptional regulator with XRE-family HTH domain